MFGVASAVMNRAADRLGGSVRELAGYRCAQDWRKEVGLKRPMLLPTSFGLSIVPVEDQADDDAVMDGIRRLVRWRKQFYTHPKRGAFEISDKEIFEEFVTAGGRE